MNLLELPHYLLLDIESFLGIQDTLLKFRLICKKLRNLLKTIPLIQQLFPLISQNELLLQELINLNYFDQINLIKLCLKNNDILPVAAFSSDGGIDGTTYNINNIFNNLEGALYSTTKSDNTHVGFVISRQAKSLIKYSDLNSAKIGELNGHKKYYFKFRQFLSPTFPYEFSIINTFTVSNKISNYTCFLEKFMVFVSLDEIDPQHPIITSFDKALTAEFLSSNSIQYSVTKSNQCKLYEINLKSWTKSKIYTKIYSKILDNKKLNIFPLLYFEIVHSYGALHVIKLCQKVPCKFLLFKLLDAHKSNDSNMDCYRCEARGPSISLLLSNED